MQLSKNDISLIFKNISDAIIHAYNGAVKYISSIKTKINKKITGKKQTDIKVVNVKIKKVTVKKQNKNETN